MSLSDRIPSGPVPLQVAQSNYKVGCAGIIVADTICGPIAQLPDEGQLLVVDQMPTKIGGCASNVAVDLAKQGATVELVGCVGNDPAATALRQAIATEGVGCDAVVGVDDLPTSTTVILLVEGEDRRFMHTFGANSAFGMEHVQRPWLDQLNVFYLGGLFVLPALAVIEELRRSGKNMPLAMSLPRRLAPSRQRLAVTVDSYRGLKPSRM